MSLRKSALTGVSAIALSLGLAYSAEADMVLPVTNLDFNMLTHPLTQQKDFFTTVQPTDWSIGAAAQSTTLSMSVSKAPRALKTRSHGNIYGVYSNPGFSDTVPAGTNFYQADGNPAFESTIFQTVSGLTAGTTYTLQFQQAAGQQAIPPDLAAPPPSSGKCFLARAGSVSIARQIPARSPAPPIIWRRFAADEHPVGDEH